jgi:aryl-alcohol dehydrogenase-like predicted oxidoreductase
MFKKKSKIVLGTVRFSSVYGIANNNKLLKLSEIKKIISYASKNNIRYLDTAITYKKTNHFLRKIDLKKFKITSKLPMIKTNNKKNIHLEIFKTINNHLKQLNIKNLYALYLHHPDDLLKKNVKNLIFALEKLKKDNVVKKIGFSVYGTKQLNDLIKIYKPDIVQLPLSVFDNRFRKKNILKKLQEKKIEIHVRSIFFQGGLTCNYQTLNKKLSFPKTFYSRWQNWLKEKNINKIRGALSILYKLKNVKVVVGVENKDQLIEINKEIKKKILKPPIINVPKQILKKLYNFNI